MRNTLLWYNKQFLFTFCWWIIEGERKKQKYIQGCHCNTSTYLDIAEIDIHTTSHSPKEIIIIDLVNMILCPCLSSLISHPHPSPPPPPLTEKTSFPVLSLFMPLNKMSLSLSVSFSLLCPFPFLPLSLLYPSLSTPYLVNLHHWFG